MTTQITDYQADTERFSAAVYAAGDSADWNAPSPCEDWTAAGVVDHVVDTQRDFLDKRGADLGLRPTGSPPEVWAAHLDAVRPVVADEVFVAEEYDGYFGRTTVAETLAGFYGFDLMVHRWDLGRALGQEVVWGDAELDRIEQGLDGFGDSLYLEGVCKPAIAVPADASRQDRLLGRMGRRA